MNLFLLLVSLIATSDSTLLDSLTVSQAFKPEWVISFADGRRLFLGYQDKQPIYYQLAPEIRLDLAADSITIVNFWQNGLSQAAVSGNEVLPQWVIYYPEFTLMLEHRPKINWFRTDKFRLPRQTQIEKVIYYPKPPTKKDKLRLKEEAIIWIPETTNTAGINLP